MSEEEETDAAARQASNDRFDDLIDKICGPGSPWSYEEAVHIASSTWDDQGYGKPLPTMCPWSGVAI